MALQVQTFKDFTSAMMQAFAAKIYADTGAQLTGSNGTVVHGSFTFAWAYNPQAQILSIQCLKKPLFIPAAQIINGLAEEVAEIIASTVKAAVAPATTKS